MSTSSISVLKSKGKVTKNAPSEKSLHPTNPKPQETRTEFQELMDKVQVVPFSCKGNEDVPFYNLPTLTGYKNHDVTKYRAPAATVKGRPPERDMSLEGPGPAAYNSMGVTRFGPVSKASASLAGRPRPLSSENDGPGPGGYAPHLFPCPKFPKAPRAYITGRSFANVADPNDSPGPGNYSAEKVLGCKLPRLPAVPCYSIKGRPRDLTFYAETGPGPGMYTYDTNKFMKKSPSPRLLGRNFGDTIPEGPGPGAYVPKLIGKRAPAAKLSGRSSDCMTIIPDKEADSTYIDYDSS